MSRMSGRFFIFIIAPIFVAIFVASAVYNFGSWVQFVILVCFTAIMAYMIIVNRKDWGKKSKKKMAFKVTNSKGETYFLHSQEVTFENGDKHTVYYFAKAIRDGCVDALPTGYIVSEGKSGLPVLKYVKSKPQ